MNMKVNQINIYGINAAKIVSEKDKSKYYGKTVTNYTPQNGSTVGWKIFYADTNNIYLIADNYVETDKLPAGTNAKGETTNNKPTVGDMKRTAYFGDSLREDYATGTDRIVDLVKKLNKSYFIDNSFTSTNENMKAVAYMLDTKAWSNFKDTTGKASYVIGGPTIEIFLQSYNEKHPQTNYDTQALNETGYQIKINGGEWKNYTNESSEYIDKNDSLYIINDSTNAGVMWIASPSANNSDYIMATSYYGYVGASIYSNPTHGFRPLVCLNSNVELQKTENGFTIK